MHKKITLFALCFMCVGLIACSSKKDDTSATQSTTETKTEQTSSTTETSQTTQTETSLPDMTESAETSQTETAIPDSTEITSAENSENEAPALTEDQALTAIKNYCFIGNPNLKNMEGSDEYNTYWNVISSNADEIVVLYRAYTGAQMRYYIDPVSGETYVTELVPGIIDEEQRTDESFNVRDYLSQ